VYTVTDIISKRRTVRSSLADSTGLYRICGLPGDSARQVFRNGVSSGEVVAEVTNGSGAAGVHRVATTNRRGEEDGGKLEGGAGSARVTGKVVDKAENRWAGARDAQGGGATAITPQR
jgi:hypothetical protein